MTRTCGYHDELVQHDEDERNFGICRQHGTTTDPPGEAENENDGPEETQLGCLLPLSLTAQHAGCEDIDHRGLERTKNRWALRNTLQLLQDTEELFLLYKHGLRSTLPRKKI